MLWYALRRLVLAVPLLLGITLISFVVIHLAPGEPVDLQTGDLSVQSSAQAKQLLREVYGLDKPSPCSTGTGSGGSRVWTSGAPSRPTAGRCSRRSASGSRSRC